MAEIPVAPGRMALVDDADAYLVSGHAWRTMCSRQNRTVYAVATVNGEKVLMHRLITGAMRCQQVDHANHEGLDNRRLNLRLCTPQQNAFNRRAARKNPTGLKGVRFEPSRGNRGEKKWAAKATLNGKTVRLGRFLTPEEAHAAYRMFIESQHGQFACPQ